VFEGSSSLAAGVDIRSDVVVAVSFAAIVLGYGGQDNLFLKVQKNGAAKFDSYGCYRGNNNGGGGEFGSLPVQFSSARLIGEIVGGSAFIRLENIDGNPASSLRIGCGVPSFSLGTGAGMAGWSPKVWMDNFSCEEPVSAQMDSKMDSQMDSQTGIVSAPTDLSTL
jgi:hypothetical protein